MDRYLIAYSTNSGSTQEVAEAIAETLIKNGTPVDVRRFAEVTELSQYTLVVIGAPMILGWQRSAIRFIKKHRGVLAQVPVAYFATLMSLTEPPKSKPAPSFVSVDPYLATAAKNPERLSLKERYASIGNYLRPMLQAAPEVKPFNIAFFGGKLELFRLKIWQMLFVMVAVGAQPGDLRNWNFIQAWATGLCEKAKIQNLQVS